MCTHFGEVFKEHMLSAESKAGLLAEEVWAKLKTGLLKTTWQVCEALHVLTECDVKLSGGVIKLKELLQLSDRHSRHGRPARAHMRPTAG